MWISFLSKMSMKKGRPPIKVKRPLAYTLLNFIYKASLPLLCHILLVSQCYLSIRKWMDHLKFIMEDAALN